jgi:hypothetical protein
VKGWSLENAGAILEEAGASNYCINGGGDIVIRGEPAPGQRWRVGIRHPLIADKLATVLAVGTAPSRPQARTSAAITSATHSQVELPTGVLSVTVSRAQPDVRRRVCNGSLRHGSNRPGLGREPDSATTVVRSPPIPTARTARLAWTPGFERWFAGREETSRP